MKTKTETLKLKIDELPPENFTGIVEYPLGTKIWYREGKRHRIDGPAFEKYNGANEFWINSAQYHILTLERYYKKYIFLGKEKGRYDLYWLKFLTETKIEEFPYIKGMEESREASQDLKLFLIDLFKT